MAYLYELMYKTPLLSVLLYLYGTAMEISRIKHFGNAENKLCTAARFLQLFDVELKMNKYTAKLALPQKPLH